MSARERVADFWDEVLGDWMAGAERPKPILDRWASAYSGLGKGKIDDRHYPDPWVGDLRGKTNRAQIVTLGLNPGIGFDALQSRDGVWSRRIRDAGYSKCFKRSPAEDPESWLAYRGRPSHFWQNLVNFTRRWLEKPDADTRDILNMELFPWHSNAKTAAIHVPRDLVDEFVFQPIAEVAVGHVFAFGSDWFRVAADLELPLIRHFEPAETKLNYADRSNWKLSLFRLPSGQILITSKQSGYSGPPGARRSEKLRSILRGYN